MNAHFGEQKNEFEFELDEKEAPALQVKRYKPPTTGQITSTAPASAYKTASTAWRYH
jgi:hypothetical protein